MALNENINNLEKDKFKDVNGLTTVNVNPITGLSVGEYDEVQATYPSSTTEVFTFKYDTSTIAVVTLTYSDASKRDLTSVVKA